MQSHSSIPPNIGGYRIIREVGRGGMSVVYLAENDVIQRRVAVKMLHPALSRDESLMQRFLSEARMVASIQHANIVQLFDVAHLADGQLYMVLEFVEGRPLHHRIREGAVPRATSLKILQQLCSAVQAAHAAGIVHRDIKAENVVLTGDSLSPVVKLLDFGVAKLAYEQAITLPGMMIGTPHYMAPEQIRGKAVDGRADIYAIGVLAYALFTGRLPFTGDLNEILYRNAHEMPPVPPDLAPGVWNVIARALAKHPDERYQSGRDFAEALEQATETDFTPELQRTREPFTVHLEGRKVRINFSTSALWEKAQHEQIAHRRFFLPRQSLPDGLLNIAFELNGTPVLEGQGEVSVRLSPEQARQWNSEPGCALALRRMLPTQAKTPESDVELVIRELYERCGANHYVFLGLVPETDCSAIFHRCEQLREWLASIPPGSSLRPLADKIYLKLQQARRDLCDLESRAAYDAELGNYRGVANVIRIGLSDAQLERVRAVYAWRHPDRIARAASLRLESDLFSAPGQAERGRQLLEQALSFDPLSIDLHRQLWSRQPQARS